MARGLPVYAGWEALGDAQREAWEAAADVMVQRAIAGIRAAHKL